MSVLEFCKQRRPIGHIYIWRERETETDKYLLYDINSCDNRG